MRWNQAHGNLSDDVQALFEGWMMTFYPSVERLAGNVFENQKQASVRLFDSITVSDVRIVDPCQRSSFVDDPLSMLS